MGEQITYSISEAIESSTDGISISYYPKEAFDLLLQNESPSKEKTFLFAQMARFNTLYMVARAGSGHLGGSFSSLDIVSWLYLNVLNLNDRYFSSKGHDAPGLYSIHLALGIISFDKIHSLRRLGGLPGHPDVDIPGAHTNTGSLGMGVSKAKGFIFADRLLNKNAGRVFVLTGDGELQEGQFWESLITASRFRNGLLTVIVDHNKLQSDTFVSNVSDLGDLDAKFQAFGFEVCRIDGHDYQALSEVIGKKGQDGIPLAIIADTIKGKGVSFMEHISMVPDQEYYKYHSGAPSTEDYLVAKDEIKNSIDSLSEKLDLDLPKPLEVTFEPLRIPANTERMIPIYSEAILEQARKNSKIVALDADLVLDTGLIPFKNEFPDRFIECGIAEQDMVSQAGTMALGGLIPIVHSFSCFLTSRASEQIYNNCTQNKKVIYVGSLAGLLPGGPGHSHQALRDITAMSSMINLKIIEPVTPQDVVDSISWACSESVSESVYIRLTSIPINFKFNLDSSSSFSIGKGSIIKSNGTIKVIVTNPIIVNEVYSAVLNIEKKTKLRFDLVYTCWLSDFDFDFYKEVFSTQTDSIFIFENHFKESGFGTWFLSKLVLSNLISSSKCFLMGVDGKPNYGRNDEVLKSHNLDSNSIEEFILNNHASKV